MPCDYEWFDGTEWHYCLLTGCNGQPHECWCRTVRFGEGSEPVKTVELTDHLVTADGATRIFWSSAPPS